MCARACVRASAGACVDVCSAIPAILCACVRLRIGGKGEKRLTRRYRETSAQRCYLCPTLLCTPCSLRAVQGCDSCCPAEATPPPPTILLCAKAAWRFAQCNSPAAIQTQDAFTLRSHDIISWAHAIWRTLHEDRSAEQVPAEQLAEAVHVGVTHQIAANDMNGRCFWGARVRAPAWSRVWVWWVGGLVGRRRVGGRAGPSISDRHDGQVFDRPGQEYVVLDSLGSSASRRVGTSSHRCCRSHQRCGWSRMPTIGVYSFVGRRDFGPRSLLILRRVTAWT